MLYLKPANTDDIEKEYLFVRDIPEDENGYINEYHGISRSSFDSALNVIIANSRGELLPEGLVCAKCGRRYRETDERLVEIR